MTITFPIPSSFNLEFGLRKEDLIHYGISTVKNDVPITIPRYIHPILAYERFSMRDRTSCEEALKRPVADGRRNPCPKEQMSRKIYDSLRPAFRLATIFIEHSLEFFGKILQASLIEDQKSGICILGSVDSIPVNVLRQSTSGALRQIADNTHYIWDDTLSYRYVAMTTPVEGCETPQPLLISLHRDNLSFARDYLPNATLCHRQRFFLHLAKTLVHELAHAVLMSRSDYDRHKDEPKFDQDDGDTELGLAWEQWFIGGKLSGASQKGYEEGIFFQEFNDRPALSTHPDIVRNRPALWPPLRTVSSASCSAFFDQSLWARGPAAFEIELTPLACLRMLVTDTGGYKRRFDMQQLKEAESDEQKKPKRSSSTTPNPLAALGTP